MKSSPAAPEPADSTQRSTRFTYASGERPLDGYTIKRGVGSGGFGEVYFAVSDAGKEVALKLIRRNLEVELRGVKECLNLKHANLVDLYDIRTDDHDDQWVVMEYVSGASLEDVIDRYPNGMPEDMAVEWFTGIASAVAYLHDRGIVHRDLKPGNIFIDEDGVKIGDYGLAKFISCSRRSGQTESVGTVHYMAPEIANGRYGREIDTYALGIIFYEMLTGHVPFEGESVGEVLMKHLTAEPDLSGLADPYQRIVRAAMAKDPDQRLKNLDEMLALLGVPPMLRPAGTPLAFEEPAPAPLDPPAAGSNDEQASADPNRASYAPSRSPAAPGNDEEPIAAAIHSVWDNVLDSLQLETWHPLAKTVGGIGAIIVLVSTWPAWGPALLMFGVFYAGYRVIRAIVSSPEPSKPDFQRPQSDARLQAATVARRGPPPADAERKRRPWRRRRRPDWRETAIKQLASRPYRERGTEILRSLLVSAVVSIMIALAAIFLFSPSFNAALCVWMAIVMTLASWLLLVPSKIAEGWFEDHAPMRFMQLLAGVFLGIVAWAGAETLMLPLPASHDWGPGPNDTLFAELLRWRHSELHSAYYSGSVHLPVAWFVAYFGSLFALLRWHRQVVPTRETRVSIWAVLWCGGMGWLLGLICWFPQPLGMFLAAATAFTLQFSSPWLPPSRRREMAEAAAAREWTT